MGHKDEVICTVELTVNDVRKILEKRFVDSSDEHISKIVSGDKFSGILLRKCREACQAEMEVLLPFPRYDGGFWGDE